MLNLGMLQPVSEQFVYQRDIAYLKRYNENNYKIVYMKSCRQPGYEETSPTKGKKNTAGNETKLDKSLSRTKAKIYELALCNPWEHFVTLTLSPDGHDRRDLRQFYKQLTKWLNNLNYRSGTNIKYLLIPEPHKDGSWHMHGLFMGLPDEWLTMFTLQAYLPHKTLSLIREGRELYNWNGYAEKFGYVTCERIRNFEACAKYVTKYITKELETSQVGLNYHLYYCSKGLKRAETVMKGDLTQEFEPDFISDYVAIKFFDSFEAAVLHFIDENEMTVPITFQSLLASHVQRRDEPWPLCLQT